MKRSFDLKSKNVDEINNLFTKVFKYFNKNGRCFSIRSKYSNWNKEKDIDKFIEETLPLTVKQEAYYKGGKFIGFDYNILGVYGATPNYNSERGYSTMPKPDNTIYIDASREVLIIKH